MTGNDGIFTPFRASAVMVDLETFGKKSNSMIVSIGAVLMDLPNGLVGDQPGQQIFLQVDPRKSHGDMDPDTVCWWMQQSDAARAAAIEGRLTMDTALEAFAEWLPKDIELWGNGATFDNVILENAYERACLPRPWQWHMDRCYRTTKSQYPGTRIVREGTHHNALSDAICQAKHLVAIYKEHIIKPNVG